MAECHSVSTTTNPGLRLRHPRAPGLPRGRSRQQRDAPRNSCSSQGWTALHGARCHCRAISSHLYPLGV